MAAYSVALPSQDTTLVLSPNSQFFRFFDNESGAPRSPAAAPAMPTAPTN